MGLVATAVVAAAVVSLLLPKQYLSVSTAIPSNSSNNDKARIFNENIEGLYSSLGSPDELDMIIGTGQLDTIYLSMTDQFKLIDHFSIDGDKSTQRARAAMQLKKSTDIIKSGYGELKVKVWDVNSTMAADIANAVMNKIQEIHTQLRNRNNELTLRNLITATGKISERIDSVAKLPVTAPSSITYSEMLGRQMQQYQELIGEYQLVTDSNPPVLLVVEYARPSVKPDKPKMLPLLLAAGLLGLILGCMLALLLERRKKNT